MPARHVSWLATTAILLLTIAGCDTRPSAAAAPGARAASAPTVAAPARGVVDSILPPAEALRRFRVGLGEPPTELSSAAASRAALVDSFVHGLERADTAALARLTITRAEFAYLVYPTSVYTRPPYQQSPDLVWSQLQAAGDKGFTRLLRRVAGKPLAVTGHRCDASPEIDGDVRLWRGCVVRVRQADGGVRDERLFGVIVERGGRFKFASYANRL